MTLRIYGIGRIALLGFGSGKKLNSNLSPVKTVSDGAMLENVGDNKLVADLGDAVRKAITPLLPRKAEVAMVDFPNHANVGDSAIWLAQKSLIRSLGLKDVYNCDRRTYSESHMASRISDKTIILLSGGGSFGDVWPEGQEFREAIISRFSKNAIIQLPQAISFSDLGTLKEARKVIGEHPNFKLFVRDKASLAFAEEHFKCETVLCPDIAFQLGRLHKPTGPSKKIVALLRDDKESKGFASQAAKFELKPMDWLDETLRFRQINKFATGLEKDELWRRFDFLHSTVYDLTAEARLFRGLRLLSEGEVVITDRLHAHILCVLLGIPNVVLDNNYRKVHNFVEVWTASSPLTETATSMKEAIDLANAFQ